MLLLGLSAFAGFAFSNSLAAPAMLLVGAGLALNFAVTADNGGMPYRPSAVVGAHAVSSTSADLVPRNTTYSHAERPSDQLMFLAEVIALPPLREVVSIGDILVALGLGLVVFAGMGTPRKPEHSVENFPVPSALVRHAALLPAQTEPIVSSVAIAKEFDADDPPVSLPTEVSSERTVPTEPRPRDQLDERIRLMKATGDIRMILDISTALPGLSPVASDPVDQHSELAQIAVGRALLAAGLVPFGHPDEVKTT